ncbi:hypothetical protein GGR28_002832 [Lewinella aquimaris]|uniref:Capsule polysaccharide biosynthesis protein n=1 Tax=Neolewinella aquimaris TaxID=1835722 RepID=A0A840E907_9BACT|nr:hypothetical protein [Neolewinella aquimaris]MBB4080202.1 hypothetical protein [Neolewinella aquimaris]
MSTLFVSLQGISPMHQATEAELMHAHAERGDRLYLLHCNACLLTCSLNSTHNILGCAVCDARATYSASRVGATALQLDTSLFPERYSGQMPSDFDELMEVEYEGVNIGRGAASSTVSILRDYAVEPTGKHRELVELQLRNAIGALRNYQQVFAAVKPERVIVFNGRHSELWPLLGLCRQQQIPFATHERGGSDQLYQLFEDSLPHSIATRQRLMRELWESTDEARARAAATDWYEAKRRGQNRDDRSYLDHQQAGTLPAQWDADKHNIAIFVSSEDEMQAIKEWVTPLFRQQNEVILRLLADLRDRTDIHLYIRMHPNLRPVDNQQTRELYGMEQANLTVIGPGEAFDTYAVLEVADVALSFASSVGVEATFWGTASVLYGRAFYEGEDAVYEPRNYSELLELLTTPALPAKSRENVLRYGYFVSHFGIPYTFARIVDTKTAFIDGRQIRRLTPRALLNLLRYLPQLPRWLRTHRTITGRGLRLSELGKLYSHLREKS